MALTNIRNEDEVDLGTMAVTAVVSFAAALGVSGGTHAVMHVMGHDLVKKHRATLAFRSAIWGDGVLIPVINCLMMRGFQRWRPRLDNRRSLISVLGGSLISLGFHIAQGRGGMVNWTMTRPWRWNLLGYYHFVYMSTQFAYMLLYVTEFAQHAREERVAHREMRDLAIIGASLVAFAVLLATDYSE